VVTPYTVTYDGQTHTATYTITGVNGETGAAVGTVTLNTTHTKAGTFPSDSWSFTGTANYNNIDKTAITDTINKANATVVATPTTNVNGKTGATVGAVTLSATVTDTSVATDSVNEGAVTFRVADAHGNTVGTAVQGAVSAGNASASFTLPAGLAPGSYTVIVAYTDPAGNFVDAGDTTGTLQVNQASAFTGANTTTFFVRQTNRFTVTAIGTPTPTLGETVTPLPAGITFDPKTKTLQGDGTEAAGTYTLTFTASNGITPEASQTFTLQVNQGSTVTAGSANLIRTSPNLTISGIGFDPVAANNTVTFDDGAGGTVTAATPTQLTVTLTTPPLVPGGLTAVITTDGFPSAAPFPVATVVPAATDGQILYLLSLYRTVLGRASDMDGITYWVHQLQNGITHQQVARGFWESAEHRGLEVDQDYATYLHRNADQDGRAHWMQAFASGQTENQVACGILTSSEYLLKHASVAAFINGLYTDVLGRTADTSGLAFWMNQAQTLQGELGTANGFLSSMERNMQVLDRYYADFLGRRADVTGQQTWLFQLENQQGTLSSVAEGFLASDEFFARATVDS
jgi:hypothetical protein